MSRHLNSTMSADGVLRRRFTLIEILTVIGIIAVLAAVILGVATGVTRAQQEAKTKARLEQMRTALQAHHQDRGYYPIMGTEASPAVANFSPFKHSQTGQPYLDGYAEGDDWTDGWKEPFLYVYERGDQHYKLWSKGADKTDNGGDDDDIASWKQH